MKLLWLSSFNIKNLQSLMFFSFSHCSFFKAFNDMMINAVLAEMNIKKAIWKMMFFSNSILMMKITFFSFFNSRWRVWHQLKSIFNCLMHVFIRDRLAWFDHSQSLFSWLLRLSTLSRSSKRTFESNLHHTTQYKFN